MSKPKYLGPYRLGDSLGRGGMGSVFAGVHEKSGDKVAVKLIAPNVAEEIRFRRRFHAEIETLKRLRHDGIVRLIGYGEEDGQLFYSMELVNGEPLQKRIRREKRLDWLATISIAIQICAALKHAHDIGVIHRDLKPANLILTADDKVKLVDFGIAKIFGYGEQTMAGSILGTADYMAPEQALNTGVTARTDLYALGSVMYAMLAGRPPFKGKRVTEVIQALKRDKPIPLEMINPDLPEALVELVHQLLEKEPKDRPPTALATMNRLKAMRAGLLREQTLNSERESPAPPEPSDESKTNLSDAKRSLGSNLPSTRDPSAQPVDPSAGTIHFSAPNTNDGTVIAQNLETLNSESGGISSDERAPELSDRPTHFQTVGTSPSESGVFRTDEQLPASGLMQGLSIGLLISALLLGVLLIMFAFKKPKADDLYNEIVSITSTQRLSDARPIIDKFMKLFPDDERFDEIKSMDMSLKLSGVVRRLQLQSKLPGKTLEAHEEAFLNAIELRSQDSELAKKKLSQWLSVFVDSTTHASDSRKSIAELVEYEIERLDRQGPVIGNDTRNRELEERIRTARELGPDEQRSLLAGIIELYADESWAEAAVILARKELAKMKNTSSVAPTP